MIGLEQWRAVVGTFLCRARDISASAVWVNTRELKTLGRHRHIVVCLFSVAAALMLCGDVESNPGPKSDLAEVMTELKAQRCSNEKFFTSISNDLGALKENVGKLSMELSEIKEKIDVQRQDIDAGGEAVRRIEERVSGVEDEIERLEQYSRRENVILYGLPEENGESVEKCRGHVIDCFNAHTRKIWDTKDFVRVHRLGAKRPASSTPRPVIARLQHHDNKFLLFEAREKLKTQGLGVANDLTPKQRGELRKLREAGKKGFFKNGQLHVVDQTADSSDGVRHEHPGERQAESGGRRWEHQRRLRERNNNR